MSGIEGAAKAVRRVRKTQTNAACRQAARADARLSSRTATVTVIRSDPAAAGHSHLHQEICHPDRSRAWRGAVEGPFLLQLREERSLDCATRWAASLGMTEFSSICECPACRRDSRPGGGGTETPNLLDWRRRGAAIFVGRRRFRFVRSRASFRFAYRLSDIPFAGADRSGDVAAYAYSQVPSSKQQAYQGGATWLVSRVASS
jgi:hypothetical protein